MKGKIWVILAIAGVLIVQTFVVVRTVKENRRLSDNFNAVMSGIQYGYTLDSLQTVRTERILLEASEIKRAFPEITRNINQLDIKMKQLERYSAVSSTANYEMANKLRDTIHIKETVVRERIVRDTLKMQYIRYSDKWIDFQQAIVADSAYTSVKTRDSIAIVQSWERSNKFLFLKWGRKRHIQTVTNANPNAKITYSVFVEKRKSKIIIQKSKIA